MRFREELVGVIQFLRERYGYWRLGSDHGADLILIPGKPKFDRDVESSAAQAAIT